MAPKPNVAQLAQDSNDSAAAYRHVDNSVAFGMLGGGYVWHGHSLRTAFLAGAEYGRANPRIESEGDDATETSS